MAFVDLNDSVIAQVRQAADIVDFVAQVTPLKLAGKSYKGLCPFHREKTPSFHVDRDKGLFYCFGCGTGGDVFKFLTLTERFTFPEAVEHVASRVGIELPNGGSDAARERQGRSARGDGRSLGGVSSGARTGATTRPSATSTERARARGDRQEVRLRLRARFVGLHPHAASARKHGEKKLETAGLVMPRKTGNGYYDRFRNRLMIPIHTETGALVGFGGRSLDGSDPKYLNSPESEIFNKSRLLYNLHRIERRHAAHRPRHPRRRLLRRHRRSIMPACRASWRRWEHRSPTGQASLMRRFTTQRRHRLRRRQRRPHGDAARGAGAARGRPATFPRSICRARKTPTR